MPVTLKPKTKFLKNMRIGECGYVATILDKRNGKLGMNVFATVSSAPTSAYDAKVCRIKGGILLDPHKTYSVYDSDSLLIGRIFDWVMRLSPIRVVNEDSVTAITEWF